MITVRQTKEIVVEVRNDIGVLHEVSRIVAEKGVNIMAIMGTVQGGRAIIRMVTEDNLRVTDALRARNYTPQELDAVMAEVPHSVGVLRSLTEKLGKANIDIDVLYASAGSDDPRCVIVFSTTNNARAIVELNR